MDFKKFVLAGILGGIIITILMMVVGTVMEMLFGYSAVALDGMRAMNDPIMMLFFLYGFVIAFTMAFVYPFINLQGNWKKKGTHFGLLCFVLAGIPSIWVVWTSMNYPIGFTVYQIIGGIIYYAIGGMIITKLME